MGLISWLKIHMDDIKKEARGYLESLSNKSSNVHSIADQYASDDTTLPANRLFTKPKILWTVALSFALVLGVIASLVLQEKRQAVSIPQKQTTFLEQFARPDISQQHAHITGNNFQSHIEHSFRRNGFNVISSGDYENFEYTQGRYVLENYPYQPKFMNKGLSDFMMVIDDRKIRVEAKWQQSRGSTDKKAAHNILFALTGRYGDEETILILDGPGGQMA